MIEGGRGGVAFIIGGGVNVKKITRGALEKKGGINMHHQENRLSGRELAGPY